MLPELPSMRALACLAIGCVLLSFSGCGGETKHPPSCANPREESPGSGAVQCDDGLVHRVAPGECAPFAPSRVELPPSLDPAHDECHTDADCDAQAFGDCEPPPSTYFKAHLENICVYGCTVDSDCDAGSVCDCGTNGGRCHASSCTSDADCGTEHYCVRHPPGCGVTGFACQTAADECTVSADCAGGFECTSVNGVPWSCVIAGCPG